ncbi:cell envelope biogenesis protein OmpA [Brevirhabdus pacifica]|uniref:Cell envelope biogenesis protein OmpA n=2 Tax=Brevirhabdus pacifica TaxID=1267768 RepID=A0A1U7DMB2_9RHOB|nr:cell envelope biogenesis protein OmpA [Brevirhabdus pacifica]OWU78855.1 cell envelope biogenesis protein OmpA [Loktanella sp. 22II-4b]
MFSAIGASTGGVLAAATIAVLLPASAATAHEDASIGRHTHRTVATANGRAKVVDGERYKPTIWVDPDGCQHWVMDDGAEGYMTPNVTRDGIPVCNRGNACMVLNTDQHFATDSYRLNAAGRSKLASFFRSAKASAYVVVGHTDSRASDAYNMRLGLNRARAAAAVGQSVGARIADIRSFGERMPKATNATVQGRAQNRRVEIMCIR